MFLRDASLIDAVRNPGHLVAKEAGKPLPLSQIVIQEGRETALMSRHFGLGDPDRIEAKAILRNGRLFLVGQDSCVIKLWDWPNGPTRVLAGQQVEVSFHNGVTSTWIVPAEQAGVHRVCRFQFLPEAAQ